MPGKAHAALARLAAPLVACRQRHPCTTTLTIRMSSKPNCVDKINNIGCHGYHGKVFWGIAKLSSD